MSEIDSFYIKFKHLVLSGQHANLNIKTEAGKAFVNLTVEVEIPPHVSPSFCDARSRTSPSRQRRTARRAAARQSAARVEENTKDEESKTLNASSKEAEVASKPEDGINQDRAGKGAEQAKLSEAILLEPTDEIENSPISDESKEKNEHAEKVSVLSVIPMKHFDMSEEVLHRALKDRIEAKSFVVKHINIHRSNTGAFIRSDILIDPIEGEIVKKTDFLFANCQVLPCYGLR